jgi:FixJ family two-component response regulator
MDLRMPGLSVEDLVSELNNRGMNIPIIIISADDNEKSRQLARKLGAGGFFSKPVDGTALLDAIKWACNTTKLET